VLSWDFRPVSWLLLLIFDEIMLIQWARWSGRSTRIAILFGRCGDCGSYCRSGGRTFLQILEISSDAGNQSACVWEGISRHEFVKWCRHFRSFGKTNFCQGNSVSHAWRRWVEFIELLIWILELTITSRNCSWSCLLAVGLPSEK